MFFKVGEGMISGKVEIQRPGNKILGILEPKRKVSNEAVLIKKMNQNSVTALPFLVHFSALSRMYSVGFS